jgi:hypothetical protein
MSKKPTYAVGITTVPQRRQTYLPHTIASLNNAKMLSPYTNSHIFLDTDKPSLAIPILDFGLHVTSRGCLGAWGNWYLGLLELYIRYPTSDRYVMVQDDVITYHNLREYLDTQKLEDNTYWNLYTFPQGCGQTPKPSESYTGWVKSNGLGRGALALVFSREGVQFLMSSRTIALKPAQVVVPKKCIDGILADAFVKGYSYHEMIHYPSLVQHIGDKSTLGNDAAGQPPFSKADTFLGEQYDAIQLCKS